MAHQMLKESTLNLQGAVIMAGIMVSEWVKGLTVAFGKAFIMHKLHHHTKCKLSTSTEELHLMYEFEYGLGSKMRNSTAHLRSCLCISKLSHVLCLLAV